MNEINLLFIRRQPYSFSLLSSIIQNEAKIEPGMYVFLERTWLLIQAIGTAQSFKTVGFDKSILESKVGESNNFMNILEINGLLVDENLNYNFIKKKLWWNFMRQKFIFDIYYICIWLNDIY